MKQRCQCWLLTKPGEQSGQQQEGEVSKRDISKQIMKGRDYLTGSGGFDGFEHVKKGFIFMEKI